MIKDFTLLWNSSGSSWFLRLTLLVPYYYCRKVGSCSNTQKMFPIAVIVSSATQKMRHSRGVGHLKNGSFSQKETGSRKALKGKTSYKRL